MKTFTTLIAATVAATLSTAAFAEPKAVRVNYSDLDLSSPAGQKALDGRITRAARFACGGDNGPAPLSMQRRTEECITTAKDQAIAAVTARRDIQMASR